MALQFFGLTGLGKETFCLLLVIIFMKKNFRLTPMLLNLPKALEDSKRNFSLPIGRHRTYPCSFEKKQASICSYFTGFQSNYGNCSNQ
jgi:hypothetical protein